MRPELYGAVLALAAGSALAEAPAAECGPLMIVARIDLVPSTDGRAEFVPVEIAGSKRLMLLDTGSGSTVLSRKVADELGLSAHRSNIRLYSVTGSYSDTAVNAPLDVGGLKSPKIEFVLAPEGMIGTDSDMAGILGADILRSFDVSVDFAANKLDLVSQVHCDGKVVYWAERPVAIVPFDLLKSGHVSLPVAVDGQTVKAILDTGAAGSTLDQHTAEYRYGLKMGSTDAPASGTLNGEKGSMVWHHTFKTLTFEGVTVTNPVFDIIPDRVSKHFDDKQLGSLISRPDEQVEPQVLLGMNVLRHLHVYIAYKEKKVYITPAGTPQPAQPKS